MPKYDINKHDASDKQLSPSLRTSQQGPEIVEKDSKYPLDSEESQKRFKKLMQWRRQSRVAQAENRMEQAIDEDFYDSTHLEAEDLHIMMSRRQPPLVYNVTKNVMNFILGTERKARFDYRVLPRKKSGAISAKAKTKVMKYIQDVSKGEYARSEAFTEAACAGVGWLEFGARNTDEILFVRSERWRNMWFDHLSTQADGSDMRYVIREKWIDLDIAQSMFPERENELKVLAEGVNSLYPYLPDDTVITDNASEFDLESDLDSLFGGPFDGLRERVKLVEMQYKLPMNVKVLKMKDDDTPYGALNGTIFRPTDEDHQYLVRGGYFTISDAYKMVVRHAIWAGNTYLQDDVSPYNHNRFSLIPIFCYRRKRDNMPYGIIRDIRDPQSDLNRRKSRSLFLLSANQIVGEKDFTDDIVQFHSEMQKPDGIALVNQGKMGAWKQVEHVALSNEHITMAQDDERFIHSISGITADAEWQNKKDLSGKAMNIQENQSTTGHGVVFDNYWYACQSGGEIMLSNIEQFYDTEKEIRITGDQQKDEFIEVNKLQDDGTIDNSMTAQKSDFIVGKQDYRETIRLQMVDQFLNLITSLAKAAPMVTLNLLDLAVELMDDLPNKDEAVARIRKINKQHAPEDELTPEEKQKAKQSEAMALQEQQMMKQLQLAMMQIKVAQGQGKLEKDKADAMLRKVEGFLKAVEVAAAIGVTPEVVGGADEIIAEAQKVGGNGGQQQQQGQQQIGSQGGQV